MDKIILVAGYPKCGNTILGEVFRLAGHLSDNSYSTDSLFDINTLARLARELFGSKRDAPLKRGDVSLSQLQKPNPFFESGHYCIKTHERYRYGDIGLNGFFEGDITKILTIMRNPFDTLLSALNYMKVEVRESNMDEIPDGIRHTLVNLIPEFDKLFASSEEFLNRYSLDFLREMGFLDEALHNFGGFGFSVPFFSRVSGSWLGYHLSYDYHPAVKPFHVSYERVVADEVNGYSTVSREIASYLDVDSDVLSRAFLAQRKATLERMSRGSAFFSKAKSGYFKEYFSADALNYFCKENYDLLHINGYGGLAKELMR